MDLLVVVVLVVLLLFLLSPQNKEGYQGTGLTYRVSDFHTLSKDEFMNRNCYWSELSYPNAQLCGRLVSDAYLSYGGPQVGLKDGMYRYCDECADPRGVDVGV